MIERLIPYALMASLVGIVVMSVWWPSNEYYEVERFVKRLSNHGSIEFLTIDPEIARSTRDETTRVIGSFEVLDSRILSDSTQINDLLNHLVAEKRNSAGMPRCFMPRHGIQSIEDPNLYVLICFQCKNLSIGRGLGGALIHPEFYVELKSRYEEFVSEHGMIAPPDPKY